VEFFFVFCDTAGLSAALITGVMSVNSSINKENRRILTSFIMLGILKIKYF
jgi:hypothetical protein